jgi:hypothetical protein
LPSTCAVKELELHRSLSVDLILYSLAPVCEASDLDSKGTVYLLLAVGACCVNTKGCTCVLINPVWCRSESSILTCEFSILKWCHAFDSSFNLRLVLWCQIAQEIVESPILDPFLRRWKSLKICRIIFRVMARSIKGMQVIQYS